MLDKCRDKAIAEDLMRHYNCVLPFLPVNKNQSICNPARQEHFGMYRQSYLKCKRPCRRFLVKFGVMNRVKKDGRLRWKQKWKRARLTIHLKATVEYVEIVQDYPLISMLAGTLL